MKKETALKAISEYVEKAIYRAYAPFYNNAQGRLDAFTAYRQAEAICLTWNAAHPTNAISLRDAVLNARKNATLSELITGQSYFEIVDKMESILVDVINYNKGRSNHHD